MANLVTITVHKRKFEFRPPCPEVESVADDFIIVVNWNGSTDWDSITVTNFTHEDGSPFPIKGADPVLTHDPDNSVAWIQFQNPVFGEGFYCKYELIYIPKDGEPGDEYTIDPTLRMRPVGG